MKLRFRRCAIVILYLENRKNVKKNPFVGPIFKNDVKF